MNIENMELIANHFLTELGSMQYGLSAHQSFIKTHKTDIAMKVKFCFVRNLSKKTSQLPRLSTIF